MKLKKLNLNELADAELNERAMCRILGGGTPACCQCSCHHSTEGGSSTSSNDKANDAEGLTSDPGAHPCCNDVVLPPQPDRTCNPVHAQESTCLKK